MTVLIIIGNGGGEIYQRFAQAQKETWIATRHNYVDVLYHSGENAYRSIWRTFEVIRNNQHYDYYLTTTASAYIDTNMLVRRITELPSYSLYAGMPIGEGLPPIYWLGHRIKQAVVSGAGILMSNDVAMKLIREHEPIEMEDDVQVGRFMSTRGIEYYPMRERVDNSLSPRSWHHRFHTDNREHDIKQIYRLHENRIGNTSL